MPKMNLLVQKPQPRQITAGISSSRYKPNQRDWLVSVSGKRYRFNSSPVITCFLSVTGDRHTDGDKGGNNREAKQELHVFGHHVHDAAGDNFCQNHPFDDTGLLTKRAFNGRIPGLHQVGCRGGGHRSIREERRHSSNRQRNFSDFQGFLLLKTRDRKDGLVFSGTAEP